VKFSGAAVRSLSPDERSAGALIKKVIDVPCGSEFREGADGVSIRKGGLQRLAGELRFAVLDEQGTDVRTVDTLPDAFLLSDHLNFSAAEEELIRDCLRISVGPRCLHADHTITVLHNELDRRTSGWK
jgi:tRNA (pseudouridine54-N1)-methyltransferase